MFLTYCLLLNLSIQHLLVIFVTFLFHQIDCLGQMTTKGPFGFLVQLPPVYYTVKA